ncbi:distal tail protein Dit [Virgibacillus pantothenticus]|uniref:distal tail protein Dit n=1 Tax=Virgibacillus pantothenticus TaxID=1473 RepID=UPI000985B626|nr:distal tail protein Dit [Virgibacillus pantothenticus]
MYKFVDLNERGTYGSFLSIQTIFNDINLDQQLTDETGSFMTLTVAGRGNVKQNIKTTQVPGVDGALETDKTTYDMREITVKYKLSANSNEGFRSRVNRLNSLLRGSKRQLRFTDEDKFYYATLSENNIPKEDKNELVCELTFLCSNPYKYGQSHKTIALKKYTWEEYAGQTWRNIIGSYNA